MSAARSGRILLFAGDGRNTMIIGLPTEVHRCRQSVCTSVAAARHGVRALFFLVEVSSRRLEHIAALIEAGELTTSVGEVLPLAEARIAHEMLAGRPHRRGKIVLTVDASE